MSNEIDYRLTDWEKNRLTCYNGLMAYFENIAINQFEYGGLDEIAEGLTSEIIEENLFNRGVSAFFKDSKLGYLCLPITGAIKKNVYRKPVEWIAFGLSYQKKLTVDDSVLIKNNTLMEPTRTLIDYYVKKLADIEITLDIHRNSHKTPIMLETTDDTVLTAKNIFNDIEAGKPVQYRNKSRSGDTVGIEVLNTDVPYIGNNLIDEYNSYVAKILTVLGISNYVEDKAERVQSAEVDSNMEYISKSFDVALESRKKAIDKINEMFGLHLTVEYKQPQSEVEAPVEEEEEDGELHGGTKTDSKDN